jgi:hypothetical protein
MTPGDFDTFLAEFSRLSAALGRYKTTPQETAAKADAYFHVLKKFPITLVIAKADAWLATETDFPKPAQWAGQIVKAAVAPLPRLSPEDEREYLRAERLRYEDAPCGCAACRRAEVHEKPLRFVPEFTEHDTERKVWCGDRIVTAGHWAHGQELFGFYRARADFWNHVAELGLLSKAQVKRDEKLPLEDRLNRIFAKAKVMA